MNLKNRDKLLADLGAQLMRRTTDPIPKGRFDHVSVGNVKVEFIDEDGDVLAEAGLAYAIEVLAEDLWQTSNLDDIHDAVTVRVGVY